MSIHTSFLAGALSALVVGALTPTRSLLKTHKSRPEVNEVTIITKDFRFEAPKSIPAGLTRIRLRNKGSEPHHAQIVRLREGGTVQELLAALGAGLTNIPEGTRFVGGPNVPPSGGWSEVTMYLEPGQYAIICFVSGADHIAHLQKGMTHVLTVTPWQENDQDPEPTAGVRMVLRDYGFEITPAIRAGVQTIRVENAAAQPHEAVLGRLAPGKTAADLLAWLSKRQGPMPGEEIGGIVGLSPGEVNYMTVDFTPGEYVLLCFVPDVTDGKSHLAHGMIRQFRVEPKNRAAAGGDQWSGVYDLLGTGFPDGQRTAVMQLAQRDTGVTLVAVQGPPGKLVQFRVDGDSAHVMWNLGTDLMVVDLRRSGDSLTGVWSTSEWSGPIHGTRRR